MDRSARCCRSRSSWRLALVSMAVYAAARAPAGRGRRRARGPQFLLGAGNFLVHWFMWVLRPVERLALPPGPDAGLLQLRRARLRRWRAGVLIGAGPAGAGRLGHRRSAASATSWTGASRGRRKVDSKYGKFIDSTLDRFVEVFALPGLRRVPAGDALRPALAAAAHGRLAARELRARARRVAGRALQGGPDAARRAAGAHHPRLLARPHAVRLAGALRSARRRPGCWASSRWARSAPRPSGPSGSRGGCASRPEQGRRRQPRVTPSRRSSCSRRSRPPRSRRRAPATARRRRAPPARAPAARRRSRPRGT